MSPAQQITLILHLAFYAIIFTFIIQRHHFLISLFSLEGMILSLVVLIPLSLSTANIPIAPIRIILLTFGACEARLGLRLLVIISRYYGNDIFKSISTNKC
jgi:NADH-ubiquinone oxidoreductase chain 4L